MSDAFYSVDAEWRFTYLNRHACALLERDRDDLIGRNLWDEFPETVDTPGHDEYLRAVRERVPVEFEARFAPLGRRFAVRAVPSDEGLDVLFAAIDGREGTEALIDGQKRALELAVHGAPLGEVLDVIARTVEAQSGPGVLASILLLDPDGEHLRHGAAPNLPGPYNEAIDGIAIGPSVGSCGTAAFTAREVIVTDIATDPLWAEFKDLAGGYGLKACWSTPILSSKGAVLGTFALYNRAAGAPSADGREFVDFLAHTAALVVERYRSEAETEAARVELRRRYEQTEHAVTERTRELARERGFLRALLDSLSEGIVACDAEGTPTLFNPAALEFHGISAPKPPPGWDRLPDLFHPGGVVPLSRDEAPLTRALRGERVRDVEMVIRPEEGTPRSVLVSGRALHDPDGNKIGAVVAQIDITARKKAEEALRELAEMMSAATGIGVFDALAQYLARTLGVDGVIVGELVGERQDAVRPLSLLVKGEIVPPAEYRLAGTPGETVIGSSTRSYPSGVQALFPEDPRLAELGAESYVGAPLFDAGGKPMGLVALLHSAPIDDAERAETILQIVAKRAEAELERKRAVEELVRRADQLERANEQLQAGERVKDEFLSALSVQLSSPINAIQAAAGVLASGGVGQLGRDQSDLVARITAHAAVTLTLVNDLLDLGRMSAGRFRLDLQEIDLESLTREVTGTLAPIAEQQGLRAIIDVPRELPRVRADALRLEQVITDYYNVAIRMTPSAGFVRVEAREDVGSIRFEIYQSGTTLAEDAYRRLYGGFAQVAGTWLGLSVARQIVEAHGGEVGGVPGAAEGNTLWFTLPIA